MTTPTLREADLSLPGLLASLADKASPADQLPRAWNTVKIAHSTYVQYGHSWGPVTIEVVLHSTTIARFTRIESTTLADGTATPDLWLLTVNTGGWDTVTTRDRLNRILRPLGLNVYRDRGTTYVSGAIENGKLATRLLRDHDGHRLPIATALVDGSRVIPPTLPAGHLDELVRRTSGRIGFAALTAARPTAPEVQA